jgi:hypothetical protein
MSVAGDRRRTFGRGGTGSGWTAGQRETTRSNARGRLAAARMDDPSVEEARAMIQDQWCWWCDRGPFRALVQHIRVHGISGTRLRRLAFVNKGTPLVSEALRESMRLRPQVTSGIALDAARVGLATARAAGRRQRVFSEAGRAANTQKLLDYNAAHPEQRQKAGQAAAAKSRQPHPCPVCGVILPRSTPRTCSPACRREVRSRTMRAVRERQLEAIDP